MNNGRCELCKVKDLIEHLKKYDPEADIVTAEMNAMDGGMWQHTLKEMLEGCVLSVKEEKEAARKRWPGHESENYINKEFIYVKDNDVIVRF